MKNDSSIDGIAEKAERMLERLSPEKRAILELRLQKRVISTNAAPTIASIPRGSEGDRFPLSFAQERLWFQEQLERGRPTYNIPGAIRALGVLNIQLLERVLKELIRRHDALRTRIEVLNGVPQQVIDPLSDWRLPVVDLAALAPEIMAGEWRRWAVEEGQRPFELSSEPLFRIKVFLLRPHDQGILYTFHHLICDGWSLGVLIRELAALYHAYRDGKESPLEDSIRYVDYAVWQRDRMRGKILQHQLDYWKGQLDPMPPALRFPIGRPDPAQRGMVGTEGVRVEAAVLVNLRGWAQQRGATPFTVYLTLLCVVLGRIAQRDEFLIGTSVANRDRAETSGLIGLLVNVVALRCDLSGNPTFSDLLDRLRNTALGAFAHNELPFEFVVRELHPGVDLRRNPLFQIFFVLQNAPAEALELPGLTFTSEETQAVGSKYPLNLYLQDEGRDLTGTIVYDPELFGTETVRDLASLFEFLLRIVPLDPAQELKRIFERLDAFEAEQRGQRERELAEVSSRKLKTLKRRSI